MKRPVLAACWLAVFGGAVQASCTDDAYRQFDFWLGDWQVYKPDGTPAGENRISREIGGCVLHERYRTTSGYEGESFNIYDASRGRWHQTWVDNGGLLLVLEGGLHGRDMVLEGDGHDAAGKPARQRITWTPNADGSVRQLWQSRTATGDWQTVFDGHYRPRTN